MVARIRVRAAEPRRGRERIRLDGNRKTDPSLESDFAEMGRSSAAPLQMDTVQTKVG
jgi:hypothetical protein